MAAAWLQGLSAAALDKLPSCTCSWSCTHAGGARLRGAAGRAQPSVGARGGAGGGDGRAARGGGAAAEHDRGERPGGGGCLLLLLLLCWTRLSALHACCRAPPHLPPPPPACPCLHRRASGCARSWTWLWASVTPSTSRCVCVEEIRKSSRCGTPGPVERSPATRRMPPACLAPCAPRSWCAATRSCACCTKRSACRRAHCSGGRRPTGTASTRSGRSRSRCGGGWECEGGSVSQGECGRECVEQARGLAGEGLGGGLRQAMQVPPPLPRLPALDLLPPSRPAACLPTTGGQPEARPGAAQEQRGQRRRAAARGQEGAGAVPCSVPTASTAAAVQP